MPEELVVITTYGDAVEAAFAKAALESAGIPVLLRDSTRTHRPWRPDVRLLVAREDAMEAAGFIGILA